MIGKFLRGASHRHREPRLARRLETEENSVVKIRVQFRQFVGCEKRIENLAVVLEDELRPGECKNMGAFDGERLLEAVLFAVFAATVESVPGKGGKCAGVGMRSVEIENGFAHD